MATGRSTAAAVGVAQTVADMRSEAVAQTGLVGTALAEVAGTVVAETEAVEALVPPTGSARTPAATVLLASVAYGPSWAPVAEMIVGGLNRPLMGFSVL